MNQRMQRVQLAEGYVLHHRPYRDTSRILEVLTREHGRLTLFARGARGPKSKLAGILRPFQALLLSWAGRGGDAAQLTGAEIAGTAAAALPSQCLMPAFYVNELMLKLTVRHDPQPQLYDRYRAALAGFDAAQPVERTLRLFEKRLLEGLGYGLDLGGIEASGGYRYSAGSGFLRVADGEGIPGRSLLALGAEELDAPTELEHARQVLRVALAQCLEGRTLSTREVARALQQRKSDGHAVRAS